MLECLSIKPIEFGVRMTDEMNNNSDNEELESLSDAASEMITGLPAPIRNNLCKAFNQLCNATLDIPISYLEGKAAEYRAESAARVALIKANEKQISEEMRVHPAYVQAASEKFSRKIVREQLNLDDIVRIASDNIKDNTLNSETLTKNDNTISDDWLNAFEKEAVQKSSDEMKMLFGKILAGEIRNPSSFSIRTLKLLSQLDNQAADLFHRLCSITISQTYGEDVYDARVVSLNGNPAQNSLNNYGLGFDELNILSEYGLIISDYNSYMGYGSQRANTNLVSLPIKYNNEYYGLFKTDQTNHKDLRLSGVTFTKSGKELLGIVDITPNDYYTADLITYFKSRKLKFELLPK